MVGFLFNILSHNRPIVLRIIESTISSIPSQLVLFNITKSICILVIVGWTGKTLAGMEGNLVGKRGKRGKRARGARGARETSTPEGKC